MTCHQLFVYNGLDATIEDLAQANLILGRRSRLSCEVFIQQPKGQQQAHIHLRIVIPTRSAGSRSISWRFSISSRPTIRLDVASESSYKFPAKGAPPRLQLQYSGAVVTLLAPTTTRFDRQPTLCLRKSYVGRFEWSRIVWRLKGPRRPSRSVRDAGSN